MRRVTGKQGFCQGLCKRGAERNCWACNVTIWEFQFLLWAVFAWLHPLIASPGVDLDSAHHQVFLRPATTITATTKIKFTLFISVLFSCCLFILHPVHCLQRICVCFSSLVTAFKALLDQDMVPTCTILGLVFL